MQTACLRASQKAPRICTGVLLAERSVSPPAYVKPVRVSPQMAFCRNRSQSRCWGGLRQ